MPAPPPLSVVIATTHPWPRIQRCLEIVLPQCTSAGAELIIADSTGFGLTPEHRSSCAIRHIVVPGASIFRLRAKATEVSTGEIVAWTEDHCLPAADWCQAVLAAHAEHPQVDLIGGAVLNGSTANLMDWANFLCTFGPFVPPLRGRHIPRVPVAANLSLKREAIPRGGLADGFIEFIAERRLWDAGKIRFDDRITVRHVQSWGFWGTPVAHFHNGRSTTGFFAKELSTVRWLFRMAVCLGVPFEILRTAVLPLLRKGAIPIGRCFPLMALLAAAHASGEFVGLVSKSAGESPIRLE